MSINNRLINTGAALPPPCPDGVGGITQTSISTTITPYGIFWKPDGTKMYARYSNVIQEYDAPTPYSVSTLNLASNFSIATGGDSRGIWFKPDGTRMYWANSNNNTVTQYTLSTPWSIATKTALVTTNITVPTINSMLNFKLSHDGSKYFCQRPYQLGYYYGTLSTSYDITSASAVIAENYMGLSFLDWDFSKDGSKFLAVTENSNDFRILNCVTPYLTHSPYGGGYTYTMPDAATTNRYGFHLIEDGSRFYYARAGAMREMTFDECTPLE